MCWNRLTDYIEKHRMAGVFLVRVKLFEIYQSEQPIVRVRLDIIRIFSQFYDVGRVMLWGSHVQTVTVGEAGEAPDQLVLGIPAKENKWATYIIAGHYFLNFVIIILKRPSG